MGKGGRGEKKGREEGEGEEGGREREKRSRGGGIKSVYWRGKEGRNSTGKGKLYYSLA